MQEVYECVRVTWKKEALLRKKLRGGDQKLRGYNEKIRYCDLKVGVCDEAPDFLRNSQPQGRWRSNGE